MSISPQRAEVKRRVLAGGFGEKVAEAIEAASADAAYLFSVDEAASFENLQVLDEGCNGVIISLG